jgi:predicted heme/steroid binding protein
MQMEKVLQVLLMGILAVIMMSAGALAANNNDWQKKTFTLQQLKYFDGKDGRPAYGAVNGIVYDLSGISFWKGGKHMNKHVAGHDLTAELKQAPKSIHSHILEKLPKVGVLVKDDPAVKKSPASPKPKPKVNGVKAD